MASTIKLTREQIFKELWDTDAVRLCKKFDISLETLNRACKKYNIPMPYENYEIEKKHGNPVIPNLPVHDINEFVLPTVRKHRSFNDSRHKSKSNILCVLTILEKYSDLNNPLSTSDIQRYLSENDYPVLDRRTIKDLIDELIELGYDVNIDKVGGKNYFSLCNVNFEPHEIMLILDSIQLNPLISPMKADSLSSKINSYWGDGRDTWFYSRESVEALAYNKSDTSKTNTLYYILDVLDASLIQSKMIMFDYMQYDDSGKLVPLSEKVYACPASLYLENETYYLSASEGNSKDIVTYRVDRMRNVVLTDVSYEKGGRRFTLTNVGSYIGKNKYGDVKIKCDRDILEKVSDDFSEHMNAIKFEKSGTEETFIFTTHAELNYMADWAAGVADKCEVIEPLELREAVINKLKNNKYNV